MKKVIPLLLIASAALPAWAAPFAQERFLIGADGVGYIADVNMVKMNKAPAGTEQFFPPDSTGIISYYGDFANTDADVNSDLRWQLGNDFLPFQVTANSLVYGNVSALGGKLGIATGGVNYYLRMDTSAEGLFKDYIVNVTPGTNNPAGGNLIGKDGTTLYFSFLYKLNALNVGANQNIISLMDTVNLNRAFDNAAQAQIRTPQNRWTFGQTWGNADFRADGGLNYGDFDLDTHFVVVKIVYQAGNDTVSVWFDPDLTKTEAEQTVLPVTRNMQFSAIRVVAQQATSVNGNGFSLDELRFGGAWDDVVVLAQQFDFVVTQPAAGGSITQNPAGTNFLEGTQVQLTALPAEGFRFVTWTGDVAAEDLTDLIITVPVDAAKAISAEFEAIPEYTITVNVTPAETGTVEAFPDFTVLEGEEVELTAIAAEGYEFVSWTRGDQTLTANPLVIPNVAADETITANFAEIVIPCTVTEDVFTNKYWSVLTGDFANFVTGKQYEGYTNFEGFLYVDFCPFVYDFSINGWLYIYEVGATEEEFFAYSFNDEEWFFYINGFKFSLTAE